MRLKFALAGSALALVLLVQPVAAQVGPDLRKNKQHDLFAEAAANSRPGQPTACIARESSAASQSGRVSATGRSCSSP